MTTTEAESSPRFNDALHVLLSLTGGRWAYPVKRVDARLPLPLSRRLFLTGRPVRTVEAIEINGVSVDPMDWTLFNRYIVEISKQAKITHSICTGTEVDIVYTYGYDNLPPVLLNAVLTLAQEMEAADDGNMDCRIPERVVSVSREGMSWTLIDPQNFLDDGRTGIYEVDLAIRTLNPSRAKQRARVFTASNPPELRRSYS